MGGEEDFLAKIAVDSSFMHHGDHRATDCGSQKPRLLAAGDGWWINDVVCTAGPKDRAFEEQHSRASVAVVLSGTFQYRTSTGGELMTPGSLLLGNRGESYECGHEHGTGDRCISFHYSQEFYERSEIAQRFRIPRIPAMRDLSPLVAKAAALLDDSIDPDHIHETALQILERATRLQHGLDGRKSPPGAGSLARITRILRAIEAHPEEPHSLSEMAAEARLSPYHFLRCFEDLAGATPHQYVLRARLRRAATRLKQERTRIIDIALDCGFADVSNFNHAFRAEFGESPRVYRRT